MNGTEITNWVATAKPGDSIIYHRGFLAIQFQQMRCETRDIPALMEQAGKVNLVQRKTAETLGNYKDCCVYEYIMQRR